MSRHIPMILLLAVILTSISTTYGAPPPNSRLAAPDSRRSAPSALNPELFGMVVRDPWYDYGTLPEQPTAPNTVAQDRMGAVLAEAGVRWVRVEFIVDDQLGLEGSFNRYDYFINTVAPANNLKVLGLLSFGLVRNIDPLDPTYGIISTTTTLDPTYGGGVNSYMRVWLDRALAISDRYAEKMAGYEVLNEQNRLPPSGDAVPPELAARLHTKFYRLFKINRRAAEGNAGAWRDTLPLIVGGLHPRGTHSQGAKNYLSDIDYLRQIYGYPPAKDGEIPLSSAAFQEFRSTYGRYPLDGLAYHPYPAEIQPRITALDEEISRIGARLDEVTATLATVQDNGQRIWITEIGYDVGRVGQNEQGQADFMRAIYTQLGARPEVATIFWFKYEDFPGGQFAPNRWGIVRIPFTLSPTCEGGACYELGGEPSARRLAFFTYRELAGLPVERALLPQVLH